MLGAIARVTTSLARVGSSVVGVRHSAEEPAYRVTGRGASVEIRQYGQRIAAQTVVRSEAETARHTGFRRLAGYFFGSNYPSAETALPLSARGGESIAMTAPVSQQAGQRGQWVIRFFLPAGTPMAALPKPTDPAVQLVIVPPEVMAVWRFTGDRGARAVASRIAQLEVRVREMGFEPAGTPAAWFYDPPWTVPMLRRNEVAVPVKATY